MRTLLFIITFVGIASQFGCKKDSMCNCTESTGGTTTESRTIDPFTKILLNNNVDLVVHTDTFYHLNVTAGSNLMDGIRTEVENGTLTLSNKNRCNWLRSFKNTFKVDVWVKSLEQIAVNEASGNIDFADTLTRAFLPKDSFSLNSGSSTGDYHLKLNCSVATLALHTGSADIYGAGHIGVNYVYDVSYGKIDLLNLSSDDIYVKNNGTNDLYLKANKKIEATIGYLGNIYYKGDNLQITQKITSSGKLIHIN